PRSLGSCRQPGPDGVCRALGSELRGQSHARPHRFGDLDAGAVHSDDADRKALGSWPSTTAANALAGYWATHRSRLDRRIRLSANAQASAERRTEPPSSRWGGELAMNALDRSTPAYAITGNTRRVGGELARNLLAAGQLVRAIVRDARKENPFV